MLPLISAKKVYRGRYGRIRLVSPNVPREKVLGILAEELILTVAQEPGSTFSYLRI